MTVLQKVSFGSEGPLAGSQRGLQTKFKSLHPKTPEQRLLKVYSGFRRKKKKLYLARKCLVRRRFADQGHGGKLWLSAFFFWHLQPWKMIAASSGRQSQSLKKWPLRRVCLLHPQAEGPCVSSVKLRPALALTPGPASRLASLGKTVDERELGLARGLLRGWAKEREVRVIFQ